MTVRQWHISWYDFTAPREPIISYAGNKEYVRTFKAIAARLDVEGKSPLAKMWNELHDIARLSPGSFDAQQLPSMFNDRFKTRIKSVMKAVSLSVPL